MPSEWGVTTSATMVSSDARMVSSDAMEISPVIAITDASAMAPSSTSVDLVTTSDIASAEIVMTGPSTSFLHERVLAKLETTAPSRLQAIKTRINKFGFYGTGQLDIMKGQAISMLNAVLFGESTPTFAEFVEHANMLSGLLYSCGLPNYEAWLEYMRDIGRELLYLEEAPTVRSESDVTEEAQTLKTMATEAKAMKARVDALNSTVGETMAKRNTKESVWQAKLSALDIMRKSVAELEQQCNELEAEVTSIKEQELAQKAEAEAEYNCYAEFKKKGKLIRDQIALRDAAEKELEMQCQGKLQSIKDKPNPLL